MPGEHISDKWKAGLEEVAYLEIAGRLAELRLPSMVICGKNDNVVPLAECRAVNNDIPSSELVLLENSGHGVSESDRALYQANVLTFLSKLAR